MPDRWARNRNWHTPNLLTVYNKVGEETHIKYSNIYRPVSKVLKNIGQITSVIWGGNGVGAGTSGRDLHLQGHLRCRRSSSVGDNLPKFWVT